MFYDEIADRKTEPSWLWEPYILNGEINFFIGEDGVGKGRFLRNLATRVAMGWPMPPYDPQDPTADHGVRQQVIMITPEDNSFDTTVHQLIAEGCDDRARKSIKDLSKVTRATASGNSARDLFSLPQDIGILRHWIERMGNVGMVIIDPLLAVATTTIAFNQQVRMNILRPLQAIAEETGVAIVIAHHFTKGVKKDLSNLGDKISGSGGLKGTARCTNVIVRHPDDPDTRVVLSLKNNLAEASSMQLEDPDLSNGTGPIMYRLEGHGLDTHCIFKSPPPSLDDRERLLAYIVVTLQNSDVPLTDKAIATYCRIPWTLTRQILIEGVKLGIIQYERKAYTARALESMEPQAEIMSNAGLVTSTYEYPAPI